MKLGVKTVKTHKSHCQQWPVFLSQYIFTIFLLLNLSKFPGYCISIITSTKYWLIGRQLKTVILNNVARPTRDVNCMINVCRHCFSRDMTSSEKVWMDLGFSESTLGLIYKIKYRISSNLSLDL